MALSCHMHTCTVTVIGSALCIQPTYMLASSQAVTVCATTSKWNVVVCKLHLNHSHTIFIIIIIITIYSIMRIYMYIVYCSAWEMQTTKGAEASNRIESAMAKQLSCNAQQSWRRWWCSEKSSSSTSRNELCLCVCTQESTLFWRRARAHAGKYAIRHGYAPSNNCRSHTHILTAGRPTTTIYN